MITREDLELEATDVTVHPRMYQRQDKANCNVCDWRIGWDLNLDVVEKYFRKHQIETGHSMHYRVMELTEQTSTYLIEAK